MQSATGMTAPPRVLIADDQEDIISALSLALKLEGFETHSASSPQAVLAAISARPFDVLIMDLNYSRDTTSGGEGLELLSRLKAMEDPPRIVAITAWGTVDVAVEAMRLGASDFILKPWDNAKLVKTVRTQAELRRAVAAPPSEAPETRGTRDLDIARRVQNQLLPQSAPRTATIECAARCLAAGAVGGDGYDFIELGSGRMAVVLADVSGKGLPAALLWANLQATLRGQPAGEFQDMVSLLRTVNRLFLAATVPEHYATMFVGQYDDHTRRLRYVNCGHNPPLLLRTNGACDRLPSTAPVVGLLEQWPAEAAEVTLAAGDTILLYSDGITEARDASDEEFGEERLGAALASCQGLPIEDLPAVLLAHVDWFAGHRPQDDRTLVALRGKA
jgi:sigma-B regulation protein RsbU (phosphoserine phosphatase)